MLVEAPDKSVIKLVQFLLRAYQLKVSLVTILKILFLILNALVDYI